MKKWIYDAWIYSAEISLVAICIAVAVGLICGWFRWIVALRGAELLGGIFLSLFFYGIISVLIIAMIEKRKEYEQ